MDAWDMPFSVILSRSTEVWAPGRRDRLDQDQAAAVHARGIRPGANCGKTRHDAGRNPD